jgi:hypothetical protein
MWGATAGRAVVDVVAAFARKRRLFPIASPLRPPANRGNASAVEAGASPAPTVALRCRRLTRDHVFSEPGARTPGPGLYGFAPWMIQSRIVSSSACGSFLEPNSVRGMPRPSIAVWETLSQR